jgi:chemotaxis protein MotB
MADLEQQIIVKKVKVNEEGAHGGAWKVAYADFVTAMMAFFLLLWLLNASEQEVLDGLSNYFTPTTLTSSSPSGSGNVFGGSTPNDPGPSDSKIAQAADATGGTSQGDMNAQDQGSGAKDEYSTGSVGTVNSDEEENRFNVARRNLETQIDELPPELKSLKDTIKIDVTDEGLRIQLIDNSNDAIFERGTDVLTDHAKLALRLLADVATNLPNPISITGHTGSSEGVPDIWELSVNRANAIRRGLTSNGLPGQRFETVIGVANTEPLIPDNLASPQNRRMTVVLLRQAPVK